MFITFVTWIGKIELCRVYSELCLHPFADIIILSYFVSPSVRVKSLKWHSEVLERQERNTR